MPPSESRIDWLSFTTSVQSSGSEPEWRALAIRVEVDRLTQGVLSVDDETRLAGRAPYTWSIAGKGIRVYFSDSGDVLFEISGEGCELLHHAGVIRGLVMGMHFRLTRFDHATDLLTETTPVDFVAASGRKFRSKSVVNTPTGQTVYCGSLKSNRYARVYRYAPPHPRHGLLRAEHVFRHADAGIAARAWLEAGDAVFSARCGKVWKWKHDDWRLTSREGIPGWCPDTKGGKVERWLLAQVAPALRNGLKKGTIDRGVVNRFLTAVWTVSEIQDMVSDLTLADAPSVER